MSIFVEAFNGADDQVEEQRGLIWKEILREGEFKFTPTAAGMESAPFRVVREGQSSQARRTISMADVLQSFDCKAYEHVQVPLTDEQGKDHKDIARINTGFVDELEIRDGDDGKARLVAGIRFTEPDIKGRVERGTIANCSSGIWFDRVRPGDGARFPAALRHVVLTNTPFVSGLKPFGVAMSEEDGVEPPEGWISIRSSYSEPDPFGGLGSRAAAMLAEDGVLPRRGRRSAAHALAVADAEAALYPERCARGPSDMSAEADAARRRLDGRRDGADDGAVADARARLAEPRTTGPIEAEIRRLSALDRTFERDEAIAALMGAQRDPAVARLRVASDPTLPEPRTEGAGWKSYGRTGRSRRPAPSSPTVLPEGTERPTSMRELAEWSASGDPERTRIAGVIQEGMRTMTLAAAPPSLRRRAAGGH